ncbi:MAG: hypothetical protein HN909_03990 [Phycisphaerales bacterium]|nr:hypothetical protein [Phycisphaerales bacterium]MBT7170913.1 hypothetical protein [Phycisphaerales bacterium]
MKSIAPILLLSMFLSACTPIDLSVSKDGKILIPREGGFYSFDPATSKAELLSPAKKATFGLYSPSGKGALLYADGVFYSKPVSKPATKIKSVENLTYAVYLPGGSALAYTAVTGKSDPELKEGFAEIHLIANGKDTLLMKRSAKLLRPLSDGSLLAIRIDKVNKSKENHKSYTGKLVRLSTAGKTTDLCTVTGTGEMFLAVRGDSKKALLVCYAAGTYKPAAGNRRGKPSEQCYEVDLATGKVTLVANTEKINYAIYSPSGKHVLMQTDDNLIVTDAAFKVRTTLATDGAAQVGGFGQSTDAYPGWYDETTIYYLRKVKVYGSNCVNMHLTLVDVKTKAKRDLQPAIDQAILNVTK